jgi:hypothetical protein
MRTQWAPQEGLSSDSRLIPVEAFDPYWQRHNKAPRINVEQLTTLTWSPAEHQELGYGSIFLSPYRTGDGSLKLYTCRNAVREVIEAAAH